MAERFLIDTSAVIKYLNGSLSVDALSFMDDVISKERNISFVSEIELRSWSPDDPDDLQIYQFFVTNSSVIGINDLIIQKAIQIRKAFKLKLPDALIAATAIVNNLTLLADNDKDFKKVSELQYLNSIDYSK